MKKLIVVIMALITIFSASVSAYASSGGTFVDWQIVDTILNLEYSSTNCKVIFFNSDTPNVNWTDVMGRQKFQKTTYSVLLDMYETLTVYGASLSANAIFPQVYDWFEYNGHCFIRITVENNVTGVVNDKFWVGNGSGKILYCDAPASETTYDVVAIAGTSNYFLTDRPAGTVGNGYLGDLQVTYDNWMNIKNILDSLSGNRFYYAYGHSINGEYRYYLTGSGYSQTYYVCNSAGQLFYYVKDDGSTTLPDGGGSTFDPTEVITAINSVYDAINSQGSRLVNSIMQVVTSANSIGSTLNMHMNNVVDGFDNLQNSFSTLNSYFTDLSGLFPVQETITLLGSDTRVAWDSADRITNVSASGFNGDLIVKERPGDLVDESGYERVTISETEYSLYNDNNGYRRIKAANEYPDAGNVVPSDTLFYFPFDDSLSSTVGDLAFTSNSTADYSSGINDNAFLFNGEQYLLSGDLGSNVSFANGEFTLSYWLYLPSMPASNTARFALYFGTDSSVLVDMWGNGRTSYIFRSNGDNLAQLAGNISFPLNTWFNVAVTYTGGVFRCYLNGVLDVSKYVESLDSLTGTLSIGQSGTYFPSGAKIDELIFVGGNALWTSSFDPNTEAIFSSVVQDYFLLCSDQEITLNFYDTEGEQVTEHRWNQYTVSTSRLPTGYSEVEYIQSDGSQYLDTTAVLTSNSKVVVDFAYTNLTGQYFGYLISNSYFAIGVGMNTDNELYFGNGYVAGGSANTDRLTVVIDGVSKTAQINSNSFSFSGSTYSSTTATYTLFAARRTVSGVSDYCQMRLYSCQIYDNGTLVRDFVPCKNPSNAVGLYDLVNGQFYGNAGTGSFTAGAEVSNGSGIGQLVGVVSSTNRNAYPDDGEQNGFYYEYIGAYTEYPSFSQTLTPTDVNGNAITMGRLEDDFSEIYMDISTMQWYCHDPQTQTEILLSSANQQIMNDTIYVRQNYTMLPADQITADALQNLLPVDSPVYLDMPEGAKLTITYDHYTGWFRMMYILMDKQTKLLSDLDIVNETIINVENTVIDITNNNPAYNVFYITKTDGTTESVGDAAKDAAVFVGDVLSMFYRLVFDDALDNAGVIQDFEDVLTTTNTGVNVW